MKSEWTCLGPSIWTSVFSFANILMICNVRGKGIFLTHENLLKSKKKKEFLKWVEHWNQQRRKETRD